MATIDGSFMSIDDANELRPVAFSSLVITVGSMDDAADVASDGALGVDKLLAGVAVVPGVVVELDGVLLLLLMLAV